MHEIWDSAKWNEYLVKQKRVSVTQMQVRCWWCGDDPSKVQHQSDIRRCSCWVCLWSDESVKASRRQEMNRPWTVDWWWWWWWRWCLGLQQLLWWRVWSENLTSLLTSESSFTDPSESHHTRNHKHISDYPHVHCFYMMFLINNCSVNHTLSVNVLFISATQSQSDEFVWMCHFFMTGVLRKQQPIERE